MQRAWIALLGMVLVACGQDIGTQVPFTFVADNRTDTPSCRRLSVGVVYQPHIPNLGSLGGGAVAFAGERVEEHVPFAFLEGWSFTLDASCEVPQDPAHPQGPFVDVGKVTLTRTMPAERLSRGFIVRALPPAAGSTQPVLQVDEP